MRKILFGGGFDPFHLGHIHIAEAAHQQIGGDVIFLPTPISVWKKESAPIEDKIKMIELSIEGKPYFSIDLFEVNSKKETNYSIDTVRYFKKKYPNDEIYYLIGGDQVNKFHLWKEADELAKLARIVYFSRPNIILDSGNIEKFNMLAIKGEMVDVSSTDIREFKSLDLDPKVLDYILDNHLYFVKRIAEYIDEKRLSHSIEVAKLAYKIAKHHNLENPEKYLMAGLLHDVGKNAKDKKAIMEQYFPEHIDMDPILYHQFIGALIAEKDFGVKDQELLEAIKYHATGNDNMSMLGMVLYASDKIEPTRGYDSSDLIAAMIDNPIKEGFKIVLKANKEFLLEKGANINDSLTSKCFKKYL